LDVLLPGRHFAKVELVEDITEEVDLPSVGKVNRQSACVKGGKLVKGSVPFLYFGVMAPDAVIGQELVNARVEWNN